MKTREEWRLEKSASDESPTGIKKLEMGMNLDEDGSEATNIGIYKINPWMT